MITLAIDIGNLILVEAALSFLGLGIKPPTPSWGNMLTGAQSYFTKGAYLVVAPGLLIFITVLCLYVIGDGVRDAFDPTGERLAASLTSNNTQRTGGTACCAPFQSIALAHKQLPPVDFVRSTVDVHDVRAAS